MSTVDERIHQIKTQFIGNTGRRVLLVEGPDDVDAFNIFLGRKFPDWEQRWLVKDAGNKSKVVKFITKEPTWIGLIDRDEWTESEITENTQTTPNLLVLPRFCLESYLSDPVELWSAFPQTQKDKVSGGFDVLLAEMTRNLHIWLRHAALWHEVRPLWQRLRGLGFPDDVLNLTAIPDDAALRTYLTHWQATLDVDAVLQRVKALEADLASQTVSSVCQRWVHAKSFYPQVVHQTLNKLLGLKDPKSRRISILRTRELPTDLEFVWRAMGL